MPSYFYINIDKYKDRQYCKIGVTENPRVRLYYYNAEQARKYALLVKYNIYKLKLLDLEKLCLDATMKYYDTEYGCAIEGRYGDLTDIIKICQDVISKWHIPGKVIEYDKYDYIFDSDSQIKDYEFIIDTKKHFKSAYKLNSFTLPPN